MNTIPELRAVEKIAAEEGKNSSVAYWFSFHKSFTARLF